MRPPQFDFVLSHRSCDRRDPRKCAGNPKSNLSRTPRWSDPRLGQLEPILPFLFVLAHIGNDPVYILLPFIFFVKFLGFDRVDEKQKAHNCSWVLSRTFYQSEKWFGISRSPTNRVCPLITCCLNDFISEINSRRGSLSSP